MDKLMKEPIFPGLVPSEILLPRAGTDLSRWAVIACDQFTSQPEYWDAVGRYVGDAPSTLRLVQPEAYLNHAADAAEIQRTMEQYLAEGMLSPAVTGGFVLTERTTPAGVRLGLMAALDLECYDFTTGSLLCRATEDTVTDRLPPRVKIREGAPLELPHVMVLIDDPACTVIEPLHTRREDADLLYDFELMEQGGHLRGWRLETDAPLEALSRSLQALNDASDGFLYAVGDGNHSLATAKMCYERAKAASAPNTEVLRYALVEIVNLHSPSLVFHPIHRLLTHCAPQEIADAFAARYGAASGAETQNIVFITPQGEVTVPFGGPLLPVAAVQSFLDELLSVHPEIGLDYIHGEADLRELCRGSDSLGILLPAIGKATLFPGIRSGGHLPRKAFSIGEAREKRYYMECRKLK